MRKFQYYKLKCDKRLADAARKILAHSGMERFCRDLQSPDEPPVLTEDRIEFASREYTLGKRGAWDLCILSQKALEELRARKEEDEEVRNFLYNYGDTNANGCENELWMLLIWAMLNGHGEELMGSYVYGRGDFNDIIDDYEEIFDVRLEGDVLREMCRYHQLYIDVAKMMEENDIPFTVDDLQTCRDLFHSHSNVTKATARAFSAMLNVVFADEIGELGAIGMRSAFDMFSGLGTDERTKLVTGGRMDLGAYPKDDAYGKFYAAESANAICHELDDYGKLWRLCGARDGDERKRRPHRKDSGLFVGDEGYDPKTAEEQRKTMEQETRERVANVMGGRTLEEMRDAFLERSGNADLFAALDDGVPMEDLLA